MCAWDLLKELAIIFITSTIVWPQVKQQGVSLVAQLVERPGRTCRRPGFDPWVGKIPWRRERLPTPVFWPGEFHGLYGVAKRLSYLSLLFYLLFVYLKINLKTNLELVKILF